MSAALSVVLGRSAQVVPALLLLGILVLTFADVVLRYVLNAPIRGALEITEFAMAGLIFAALPLVTLRRENVVIDILDSHLKPVVNRTLDSLASLVAGACSVFLAWRLAILASSLADVGETTAALQIPVYLVAWFMAALAGLNALTCLVMFARDLAVLRGGDV
jgi:TRAP-type C4-dicarboxylate transport system permease small subunit